MYFFTEFENLPQNLNKIAITSKRFLLVGKPMIKHFEKNHRGSVRCSQDTCNSAKIYLSQFGSNVFFIDFETLRKNFKEIAVTSKKIFLIGKFK